jgi:homoserine O-acetyltransferase
MRFGFCLLFAIPLFAATYPTPVENDWMIRDFRFQNGELLPELRLHYATVGAPSGEPVMLLHGTGGSGATFLEPEFGRELFGPGQPLDANRYFIILPDGIGAGKSSKPSDGLKGRFPHYNYEDMVRAQHRLVTEHLGVSHLRLILGGSMGGMHAWMWGEIYPDFMDALMPLQCLPVEIAGMNRMLRRVVIDSIRNDPDWRNGDYQKPPVRGLVGATYGALALFGNRLKLYQAAPTREQADAAFDRRVALAAKEDANDILYAYESSGDYNPAPGLEKIRARVLAINTADDIVNPPELGIMEREMKRVRNGVYELIPLSADTAGHGSYHSGRLYRQYLTNLLAK